MKQEGSVHVWKRWSFSMINKFLYFWFNIACLNPPNWSIFNHVTCIYVTFLFHHFPSLLFLCPIDILFPFLTPFFHYFAPSVLSSLCSFPLLPIPIHHFLPLDSASDSGGRWCCHESWCCVSVAQSSVKCDWHAGGCGRRRFGRPHARGHWCHQSRRWAATSRGWFPKLNTLAAVKHEIVVFHPSLLAVHIPCCANQNFLENHFKWMNVYCSTLKSNLILACSLWSVVLDKAEKFTDKSLCAV